MRSRFLFLAFPWLVAVAAGCGPSAPQPPDEPGLEEQLARYLAPLAEQGNFSGSIAVARQGRVLASFGLGSEGPDSTVENRRETRHHVASISKSFTAMAIMCMVDDGVLALDDTLGTYLPDFPNGDEITMRHLLSHTSGIPDINRLPAYGELALRPQTAESLVTVIAEASTDAHPGGYRYSNSNYNLLARILELVGDRTYAELMAERVFEPLGLASTAHAGSPRDEALPRPAAGKIPAGRRSVSAAPDLDWSVKTGNGSLVSTVGDLLTFLHRLVDRPILSESSLEEMLTAHVDERIGYGWFVSERFGRRVYYMNGNTPGYSSSFEFYPDEVLAVAVLANHDIALASSISRDMAAIVLGEEARALSVPDLESGPSEFRIDDYVGSYPFGVGFEIVGEDGELVATGAWPRYPVTLVPVATDTFFHRFWWAPLRFDRDGDGRVVSMTWNERSVERRPAAAE